MLKEEQPSASASAASAAEPVAEEVGSRYVSWRTTCILSGKILSCSICCSIVLFLVPQKTSGPKEEQVGAEYTQHLQNIIGANSQLPISSLRP